MVENVREEIEKELSNGRGIFLVVFLIEQKVLSITYHEKLSMKSYRSCLTTKISSSSFYHVTLAKP